MNRRLDTQEVLTLAEAAKYLRLKPAQVRGLAERGEIPARQAAGEWRFLKALLQDWLGGRPNPTTALLQQAGTLAGDETLPDLLREIYKARGRPEDGELDR